MSDGVRPVDALSRVESELNQGFRNLARAVERAGAKVAEKVAAALMRGRR
jgi:hypothetical protein